jgi:hypothetical protein
MSDNIQTNIFHLAQRFPNVAELCNALYERELANLAASEISDPLLLKRKLTGLSYHIKNAAQFLLNGESPLEVDVHNGTWKAKQSTKCPAVFKDLDTSKAKNLDWFNKYARHGYVVCVYVSDFGEEHIELDSIDMLPNDTSHIHLNKFGWFERNGDCLEDLATHKILRIVKPTKSILSAACGGHTWNSKGRRSPRTLTLRELLLSTNINWKTFK